MKDLFQKVSGVAWVKKSGGIRYNGQKVCGWHMMHYRLREIEEPEPDAAPSDTDDDPDRDEDEQESGDDAQGSSSLGGPKDAPSKKQRR